MVLSKPINRWSAFALHLLLSLAILALSISVALLWLFPGGLFQAAGGWEGLRIVGAVDLALGPCLTLIVFNPQKPRAELVRDLSLIALVQVLALGGGAWQVANARPLAVVQVFDTFYVLNREDYRQLNVAEGELDRLSGWTPKYFYVEVPENPVEFVVQHTLGQLTGEKPLQQRMDLYRELTTDRQGLEKILHGAIWNEQDGCFRVDIESSYRRGSICFDPQTRRMSDFVPEHS
ncbi:hypothetical protein SAMN04244573_02407 [Azotobacter beijerinckii]|uniref:Type IV pilin accessory protein n=1 Tax=Azotobacter beijerinckii TaxID=170623 RepID=A0A1H9JIA7_9GAMM|nr:hypothetical protein [Azotobacter beijerinckii]SEQ86513.1 hypothetical protein SAMN04244573_02407 [Azotobacter beijerinckii]